MFEHDNHYQIEVQHLFQIIFCADSRTFMQRYLSDYPKLVKEFHPIKNGDLEPTDFTYGSSKNMVEVFLKQRT